MGVYFDLGRPVVGGWVSHDPVRDIDLLWGSELNKRYRCSCRRHA